MKSLLERDGASEVVGVIESGVLLPKKSLRKSLARYLKTSGLEFFLAQSFKRSVFNIALSAHGMTGSRNVASPLFSYGRLLESRGIPARTTADVNADETVRFVKDLRPDLIVILLFAQILKQPVLDIPGQGVLNFHPSLLPRNAGLMPVFWCLADGERETGATVHSVDVGIDSGEILAQTATPVIERDTEHSLYARICCLGASLVDDVISRLEHGEALRPIDTSAAEASYHSIPDRDAVRRYRASGRKYFRVCELLRPFDSF